MMVSCRLPARKLQKILLKKQVLIYQRSSLWNYRRLDQSLLSIAHRGMRVKI
uniref:Uncharacterized protein n=1 Tax=Arundo donax TaxID=35708 RepID=A0A0A9DRT8_ARUDO